MKSPKKKRATPNQHETNAADMRGAHTRDTTRTVPAIGAAPIAVLYWRCFRVSGDQKTPCRFAHDDGVEIAEWPIADLSLETIRARWGTGSYKMQWLGERDGKRVPLGWSKIVTLTTPKRAEVAPQPARVETELDHYLRLQRVMRQDLQSELERKDRERERELERRDREHDREIERERLASQERIAQVQSFWQAMATAKAPDKSADIGSLRVQIAKLESRLELERTLARSGSFDDEDDEDEDDGLIFGIPKDVVQGTIAAVVAQVVERVTSAQSPALQQEPQQPESAAAK